MARVERPDPTKESLSKKRKTASIFKKILFPKSCLTRILFFLVLLLGSLVAWLCYLGLIEVPVFTQIFYRPIQPIRKVEAEVGDIGDRVSGRMELSTGLEGSVALSEGELTALIAQALEANRDLPFRNVQAAIANDSIEFFGEVVTDKRTYLFSMNVVPEIELGELQLKVVKSKFERLTMPSSMVEYIISDVIGDPWQKFNDALQEYILLNAVELRPQEVIFVGRIVNSVLPL